MDWAQFQSLGYGTAAAVTVIVIAVAILRKWRDIDGKKEERNELLEKYRAAVDSRDLELAGTIASRLRELEIEIGK